MRGGQLTQDTAANPEGAILENVPATIVAPVPGPPDFNGASAVIARLPNIGACVCFVYVWKYITLAVFGTCFCLSVMACAMSVVDVVYSTIS